MKRRTRPLCALLLLAPNTYSDAVTYLGDIGRLTGRTQQADAAVQRFLDKLAAYQTRSPKSKSALLMWTSTQADFGIDSARSQYGGLLAEVTGYPWPAGPNGAARFSYSLEKVLEIDPDVLFVATYAGSQPVSQKLAANPLWGQLKAVKSGQVHEVDFQYWVAGRGTRAMGIVLDQAMPKLYPDVFPRPLP